MNEKGCAALHYACMEGLDEVVRFLLERGASVRVGNAKLYSANADSVCDVSPLQAAVLSGSAACTRAILGAGATDSASMDTAVELAEKFELDEIVALLRKEAEQ